MMACLRYESKEIRQALWRSFGDRVRNLDAHGAGGTEEGVYRIEAGGETHSSLGSRSVVLRYSNDDAECVATYLSGGLQCFTSRSYCSVVDRYR